MEWNSYKNLVAGGAILTWGLYKMLKKKKPLRKYEDFQSKATEYLMKKDYAQALDVKLQAVELEGITNIEKGDLYYGIGGIYLELKDYQTATEYFDLAFQVVNDEKIPYDKRYTEVLDAYVQAGRKADAEKLLNNLLERQRYNKRFKKLEVYRSKL